MEHKWKLGLLVILGGLSIALNGQSTEWNLDFEEWDLNSGSNLQDSLIENHIAGYPQNWFYDPNNIPEGTGIGQSTDATSGQYGVTLSGFYTYPVMRIQTGSDPLNPGWPINYRPSKLIGSYKAILLSSTNATCDSLRAYVSIYLTKYNSNKSLRDTIGHGHISLIERDEYEVFEVDINYYVDDLNPDTVSIVLAKERFGICGTSNQGCYECSHVYFDNLSLNNTVSVQSQPELNNLFEIFPNPATHNFLIKPECEDCLFSVMLINKKGQIVKRLFSRRGETEIDISTIEKGLYLVKIAQENFEKHSYKKLIIE